MKGLRFLVSGTLLAVLAWRTDWEHVSAAFAGLRAEFWLAALGLYALTQVVSAWRWRLLSAPLGFNRPLGHFLGFYFIGMFFNLMLPTSVGGDVVRAWYLDGRSGRRLAAFLSVAVDRGSGLVVLLALACVATAFSPVALPAWIPWSVYGTAAAAAAAIVAVVVASARRPTSAVDVDSRPSLTALPRLAAQYLHRPGLLAGTALLSVIVQAANVVLVWLVGQALGVDVAGAYYWIVVPMVTLLTLLPSINGMGVREWGMTLFLVPLGVPAGTAVSLAFLWFAVFGACSLAGGAVYLLGRFPRPEVKPDHGPVGYHSHQGRARQLEAVA